MDTINNMANAAAQAVWGKNENKEEPISGQTGDVSKGEPYDAGNKDAALTNPHANTATNDTTETARDTTATNPTAGTANPSTSADATGRPAGGSVPDSNPAAVKDSSTTSADQSKAQNDVRDPSDPATDPKKTEQRHNVDDSTGGQDKDENPVKVDGPGPKPIEDVAREHGGDAGAIGDTKASAGAGSGSGADAGGAKEGEEDGPQKESKGEGTGEQYVKSTGLQANGGDFDATKPGAGREADRLLEEMGKHNPADAKASKAAEEDVGGKDAGGKDTTETPEKKGLGQKIKDKLHRH